MRAEKPKVKSNPLPDWPGRLQASFERLLRQLFGLTEGWEKRRDILRNNTEMGHKYLKLGYYKDAIFRFRIVTWLEPKRAESWYWLGCAWLADGNRTMAVRAFTKALKLKAGYEEAGYLLAVTGGRTTPERQLPRTVPLSLARDYFDGQAADYDRQGEIQGYEGHALLCNALKSHLASGRMDYELLELGCGTGLCGPLMRGVAAQLTGVDLSAAMLAQAAKRADDEGRKIYDALIEREARAFMSEVPSESADIVLAAELFSVMGNVETLFADAARVLRESGLFAFTADKRESGDYRFDPENSRFGYAQGYLLQLAAANELKVVACAGAAIYPGEEAWLCVLRK